MRVFAFVLILGASGLIGPAARAACPGTSLTNGTTANANEVMAWLDCKAPLDAPAFVDKVGIGTSTFPSNISGGLTIYGAANPGLSLRNSSTGQGTSVGTDIFLASDGSLEAIVRQSNSIHFSTASVKRLSIGPSGNVGIGTANPTLGSLQIDGSGNQVLSINSSNDDSTIRLYRAGGMKWRIYNNGANDHLFILDADQDNGVVLYQNANSWASASDARLKRNARSLSVLARLSNYRAVSFD